MRGRAVRAWGSALALSFSIAPASAASDGHRFRWSWVRLAGAENCPPAEAIAQSVRQRLGRDPFHDGADRDIEGTVSRTDDRWRARLSVIDASGQVLGSRELESTGTDCSTLAEAVTFAVALTIDPQGALAPPAPGASNPAALPAPPAAAGSTEAQAAPPRDKPSPATVRSAAPAPGGGQRHAERQAAEAAPNLSAALRALFVLGLLPKAGFGAESSAELELSSFVGLTGGVGFFPEVPTRDDGYAFGLSMGGLGLCVTAAESSTVRLGLCAEGQLGVIHVAVYAVDTIPPGDHTWGAARAGPRLAIRLVGPLRLDLGAHAVVPFIRHRFALRGVAEPVFQSSPVALGATLGFSVSTP